MSTKIPSYLPGFGTVRQRLANQYVFARWWGIAPFKAHLRKMAIAGLIEPQTEAVWLYDLEKLERHLERRWKAMRKQTKPARRKV